MGKKRNIEKEKKKEKSKDILSEGITTNNNNDDDNDDEEVEEIDHIDESSIEKFEAECEGKSTLVLILKFIKQFRFKVGSNVNSIPIPVVFISTKSMLSYFTDGLQFNYNLLLDANNIENSLERQFQVYRYILSTLYHTPVLQKPLNPVLGETRSLNFHIDLGEGKEEKENFIFVEQISHHPPTFVATAYNKKHGVRVTINYTLNIYFMGSYVKIDLIGKTSVELEKFNEIYEFTSPSLCGRYLRGFSEYCGEGTLISKYNSKYKIITNHMAKSLIGGDYDKVDTTVIDTESNEILYNIYGTWSNELKIKDLKTKESKSFYQRLSNTTVVKVNIDSSLETDSLNVWKGVYDAHNQGNSKLKSLEKRKVEKHQRQLVEERKMNNIVWKPKHFFKNESTDIWELINY